MGNTKSGRQPVVASVLAAWMSEILVGAAEWKLVRRWVCRRPSSASYFWLSSAAPAESGSAIAMARKTRWISRWASPSQ